MNLEIGMYCYDKSNRKSGIGKIIEFRKNNNAVIEYKSGVVLISVGNIIASHNLIDLIEVGDYVNGLPVIHNAKNNGGNIIIVVNGNAYTELEIRDIVTKEQMESTAYEVEK